MTEDVVCAGNLRPECHVVALVHTRVWLIIYPYSPENGMAVSAVVYKHVKCDLCEVGGKKSRLYGI